MPQSIVGLNSSKAFKLSLRKFICDNSIFTFPCLYVFFSTYLTKGSLESSYKLVGFSFKKNSRARVVLVMIESY